MQERAKAEGMGEMKMKHQTNGKMTRGFKGQLSSGREKEDGRNQLSSEIQDTTH